MNSQGLKPFLLQSEKAQETNSVTEFLSSPRWRSLYGLITKAERMKEKLNYKIIPCDEVATSLQYTQ